jgi:chaperonin GroEL
MSARKLVFQPQAQIATGFAHMAALMAATLGPNRGVIWNAIGTGKPEALTDSGVIARRVTRLKGDAENTGAMIIRQAAMSMHERYLDGAAITATLAYALVKEAHRLIAAGINPMMLRCGIEQGVQAACASLMAQAQPADTRQRLTQIALTATGDQALAEILGEMFDLLGKTGAYVIDEYAAPMLDHEYVEGGRWSARPVSRELMPPGADLVLEQPLIFVSADKIERFDHIQPALEITLNTPGTPLLIIASAVSGEALHALTLNHTRGTITASAALLLSSGDALTADLEDVAVMTGAQAAAADRGSAPQYARPAWLGRARRVVLKRDSLTIIGGNRDHSAAQRRVQALRSQLKALHTADAAWEQLRLRIARLSGGMGILKIGALSFQERDERKERARKAVRVLETALEGGAVPGGGAAYLNAIPSLSVLNAQADGEISAGVSVLRRALQAPFLQLVSHDDGILPQVALHEILKRGGDTVFDLRMGEMVSCWEAGILDSAPILCAALQTAASAAIMALTTDVVIVER